VQGEIYVDDEGQARVPMLDSMETVLQGCVAVAVFMAKGWFDAVASHLHLCWSWHQVSGVNSCRKLLAAPNSTRGMRDRIN
jgi:hypothetical protein